MSADKLENGATQQPERQAATAAPQRNVFPSLLKVVVAAALLLQIPTVRASIANRFHGLVEWKNRLVDRSNKDKQREPAQQQQHCSVFNEPAILTDDSRASRQPKVLRERVPGPQRDMDPELAALARSAITDVDELVKSHRFRHSF